MRRHASAATGLGRGTVSSGISAATRNPRPCLPASSVPPNRAARSTIPMSPRPDSPSCASALAAVRPRPAVVDDLDRERRGLVADRHA